MDDEQGALPPKEDFSAWYNELLWRAEIMDVRYPVKGLYVWYPFGFALRKNVYGELRILLDRTSIEVFGNRGAVDTSRVFFPDPRNRSMSLTTTGEPLRVHRLTVHELKSAFTGR